MTSLTVSVEMLRWTAGKLGTTLNGLADELVKPSRTEQFLKGELTTTQATTLAAKAGIPFGYLFLERPPERRHDIPDLRQTPDAEPLGDSFFDLLDDIEAKMAWFRQHLRQNDIPGPRFVARYSRRTSTPSVVARDIAKTLQFGDIDRAAGRTLEGFFKLIAARLEDVGVLVFRSGVAKGNPHKPLPVSGFRGFAIADSEVPVIFVNGRDSPAAWIFTLLHEAAHIWLGVSGVSDLSASTRNRARGTEAFCNQVAAEVLTPEQQFRDSWDPIDPDQAIPALARHFGVSRLVIARRALDFGFIDQDRYDAVASASVAMKQKSGGNPYATIPIRSSRRLTAAVLNSAMAGETMLKEAGRLLNSSPSTVVELHRRRSGADAEEDTSDE